MSVPSWMSPLPSWLVTPNAISSLESVSGPTLCDSPDGLTTGPSGPAVARANLSARQVKEQGLMTSGTYGPRSTISLNSVALQQSLESKLRHRTDLLGSTLYKLTWKIRVTPAQRSIYALRASALRISDNAFTGLPTPSGTSNHGKNHVAGRLDEWGGSSNPFRGTSLGRTHSPAFELWIMGLPAAWREQMPPATPSSHKSRRCSLRL